MTSLDRIEGIFTSLVKVGIPLEEVYSEMKAICKQTYEELLRSQPESYELKQNYLEELDNLHQFRLKMLDDLSLYQGTKE